MSDRPRPLETIQHWMQSVITNPRGIESGIESDEARCHIDVGASEIEQVVLPSRAQSSTERLGVYGRAYFARLLECMRELFPALAFALGEEVFDQFAVDYLRRYPPRSYTLGNLADNFVEYLTATRPTFGQGADSANASAAEASWPDFIIDLARLEWHVDDVFDGPGVESQPLLTAEKLAAVPSERWPQCRLIPAVCLRLLEFTFPINDYYTSYRQQQAPPIPQARRSFVALTRREYVVRRFELSCPQFLLLTTLIEGRPVVEGIARCAEACQDDHRFAACLHQWFRQWATEGFFQDIQFEP